MADFLSLTRGCGTTPIKGTKTKLYAIPLAEINDFPSTRAELRKAADEPIAQGDTKIIDEAFSYVADSGKGYHRTVDILVNTGDVANTLSGEVGGQENEVITRFYIQGNSPREKEFVDMLMKHNGCLHLAIPTKDGQMQSLGDQENPVFVRSYDGGSGGGQGGERVGYSFELFTGEPLTNRVINVEDHPLNLTPNE